MDASRKEAASVTDIFADVAIRQNIIYKQFLNAIYLKND
jgi:hypothetical protein